MKRAYVVLLAVAASLGLLLVLFSVIAGRSAPTLAAPRLDYAFSDPLSEDYLPLYQTIYCTLATTTTDSLPNNNDYTGAAPLAPYTNLALATGNVPTDPIQAPAGEDWFRLDNAGIGSTYEVKAVPDRTNNYNLGIIVYDGETPDTPIITDTNTADYSAEVTLVADGYGPYLFKVFQVSDQCTGKTYHLDFSVTTPTPTTDPWDEYEPNDRFDEVHNLPVAASATLEDLNFYPYSGRAGPDEDWFAVYVKNGRWYQATTSGLNNVDTYMEIRNQDNSVVKSSEDEGGGFASLAKWSTSYDGYYYIRIINRIGTSGSDDTYDLTVEEVSAAATATPGPSATPGPGPDPEADSCEDNCDLDLACVIPVNESQTFNLVPPYGGVDNDFYKIWVKPGLIFECATSDLSPGVDTNMIVFNGPSWDNAIGGNDDVEPGNYDSYFAYYATYEGWLYLLVGTGDRTPSDIYNSNYTLRCNMQVPGQPTATGTPQPTATPGPETATPTPSGSPVATPPPSEGLTVHTLTTPTPVPATTPAPRFIPITLLVYYDTNDDHQAGAGEGIAGVSAQAYEAATNQLLAQGFTDEQGNLEFTVAAQGPVRVSVPFFGFSQLVAGEGASIYVRVPPQPPVEGGP